jgi:hypothetical protein
MRINTYMANFSSKVKIPCDFLFTLYMYIYTRITSCMREKIAQT